MNCPKCKQPLTEANFHLDTCEDICERNMLQVVASHGACGYIGFCMVTPWSFVEVPS